MNRDLLKNNTVAYRLTPPQYLYQYYSNIDNALANIKNKKIYLKSPEEFNDIFDGTITMEMYDLLEREFNIGIIAYLNTYFLERGNEIKLFTSDFIGSKNYLDVYKNCLTKNIPNNLLVEAFEHLLRKSKNYKLNALKMSCFTEKNDNLLMWSHYANNLKGVCLKFDTTKDNDLFSQIHPIKYTDYRPRNLQNIVFTKSTAWSYEQEWRLIIKTNKRKISTSSLAGIIVGDNLHIDLKRKIKTIAHENKISFEIATPDSSQYKINIEEDKASDFKILY